MNARRCPYRSPSLPKNGMPTANAIAGAVCTHVITDVDVSRSRAMAGNDADSNVDGNALENTPTSRTVRIVDLDAVDWGLGMRSLNRRSRPEDAAAGQSTTRAGP